MGVAALLTAAVLAATPASYVASRQQPDGGFAEAGSRSTPGLTAWAMLGLRAAGQPTGTAYDYLVANERELQSATDIELAVMAEAATGARLGNAVFALHRSQPSGRPDRPGDQLDRLGNPCVRPGGAAVEVTRRRISFSHQRRSGGWGWIAGAAPDSNDTAAVIQALRTQGVRGGPIARGIAFLRRLQNADGGFELTAGRGSDAQSTAWAIQAFVAARVKPPAGAFRYLAALRRADGSYRYSRKYGATPVWVTAQVLPALARKSFPLR